MANNLDICNESTDKMEKHIRLTMETERGDFPPSQVASPTGEAPSPGVSARSTASYGVNRKELIQKIEELKKRWTFGMQHA